MSQQIDAIYDHGVLKPLEPLSLPDQTRVKLTVEAQRPTAPEQVQPKSGTGESDVLAKQKAALEELRRAVDQLPQHRNNDGWSVRQHDELLYGGHK
jgi:predicted DNA-binding antitoxin AbrB/MazE fold protein